MPGSTVGTSVFPLLMIEQQNTFSFKLTNIFQDLSKHLVFALFYVTKMLVFPFLIIEQHTTFKESMVNRLSNVINCNRSADKLSQVLCSDIYMLMVMMIVLIVVLVALNMTITTWWQRCWWQWQEWVLNRPNLTGAVLPAHMWPRGFSLSTFAILSLLLIELASMWTTLWYFCKLPPVFTKDLSDGKIFVVIVFFFSKLCDNDVLLTHATIAWIFQV